MSGIGHPAIHVAFVVALGAEIALGAPTAAEKCEATKNKVAGKYALCRGKAEAKAIKQGAAPDYAKCDDKLDKLWARAEQPAACLDAVTTTAIRDFVTAGTDTIAGALAGGALPECGDGDVNAIAEHCDGTDLDGYSCDSLGHLGGNLGCDASCDFEVSGCASCTDLGGVEVGGSCWFLAIATDCGSACAAAGLSYSAATATYAGSSGTLAQCYEVMDALGQTYPPYVDVGDVDCLANANIAVAGLGCVVTAPSFPLRLRCTATATVSSASHPEIYRACACE